ncbi:hypothetical protein NDU88_001106 [Pleurodeles waltl]|uniref:Uncharacterized protein n=1 Tax=Pleurodeles waltl TaxID=8319 RepID=A0AAV7SZ31_PLEWA|nr:hypothetical protein NDU88_001106 [Pleurodeles waltl]
MEAFGRMVDISEFNRRCYMEEEEKKKPYRRVLLPAERLCYSEPCVYGVAPETFANITRVFIVKRGLRVEIETGLKEPETRGRHL